MKIRRRLSSLLVVLIASLHALALATPPVAAQPIAEVEGVVAAIPEAEAVAKAKFELPAMPSIVPMADGFVSIRAEGAEGYTAVPNAPSLPFFCAKLDLPPNARIKAIGLANIDWKLMYVEGRVEPAAHPLPFMPGFKRIMNETYPPKPDPEIYGSREFWPGSLVHHVFGKSRDRGVLYVWIYPVQYSPARNLLLIVRSADLIVAYDLVALPDVPTPLQLPPELEVSRYVIITTPELKDEVALLAEFYSETIGIPTAVVDTSWIWTNYPPAENITMYRGFYTEKWAPLWPELALRYNWSLALRIVSFLRDTDAHPNMTNVLLVGSPYEVPPSFYYWSEQNYIAVDAWNAWVPTDFFYASPDYDLVADFGVGRIPLATPADVTHYIRKAIDWNELASRDPAWFRRVRLCGGYPFGLMLMHGESFISDKMLKEGIIDQLQAITMYRTDGTYSRSSVLDVLNQSDAGWFFIICHGLGSLWADPLAVDGMVWETLVESREILGLPPTDRNAIIASPACMAGSWDEEILWPWWFVPPSIGKATLLSPAGGIAYLGASRAAWASLDYQLTRGVLDMWDWLACYYIRSTFEAYRDLAYLRAPEPISLGDVVREGSIKYLLAFGAVPPALAELTLFGFNPLLGDSLIQLPTFAKPFAPVSITYAEIANAVEYVPVELLFPFLGSIFVHGEVPYVPYMLGEVEFATRTEPAVDVVRLDLARLFGWGRPELARLFGWRIHELIDGHRYFAGLSRDYPLEASFPLSFEVAGHLLLRFRAGNSELRIYCLTYGLETTPAEATVGSKVTVRGPGLDVLFPPETLIGIGIEGSALTPVLTDFWGLTEAPLIIPLVEPGAYSVSAVPLPPIGWLVRPALRMPKPYGIIEVGLYTALSELQARVVEIEGRIATIQTSVGTIRVLADQINATVVAVKGDTAIIATNLGAVLADLASINATVQRIEGATAVIATDLGIVKASLEDVSARLVGIEGATAVISTTVGEIVVGVEDIDARLIGIEGSTAYISTTVDEIAVGVEDIDANIAGLSRTVAVVETTVGTISIAVEELEPRISAIEGRTVVIETALGEVRGVVDRIEGDVAVIKTDVGEIEVSASELLSAMQEQVLPSLIGFVQPVSAATLAVAVLAFIAATASAFLAGRYSKR